jgi:hypothetical protein
MHLPGQVLCLGPAAGVAVTPATFNCNCIAQLSYAEIALVHACLTRAGSIMLCTTADLSFWGLHSRRAATRLLLSCADNHPAHTSCNVLVLQVSTASVDERGCSYDDYRTGHCPGHKFKVHFWDVLMQNSGQIGATEGASALPAGEGGL